MSVIGKNIKKIRSIKKLNQQDFADIFEIKRASVGAYEEGRADPKIKTIVDITNKFGISLDLFLTKEMTVNDLYRFDLFREDLTGQSKHNLTPSILPIDILPVVYVSLADSKEYLNRKNDTTDLAHFPSLSLPLAKGFIYRAFELNDSEMQLNGIGPGKGDLVVCKLKENFDSSQLETGKTYLVETKKEVFLKRLVSKSLREFKFKGDHQEAYEFVQNPKDIHSIYTIALVITNNISNGSLLENRLLQLERSIQSIQNKN